MEDKKLYLSKTLWTNIIISVCAMFIPAVAEWISGHVSETALIWSGINMILRLLSKDKIIIW